MSERIPNEAENKLNHLEQEVNALKTMLQQVLLKQESNTVPVNKAGSLSGAENFNPAEAEATFRQALVTLKTIATLRNERFIFIAAADPNNVMTSGPQPVQNLLTEEIKPLLANLGAALSSPTRLKILYILLLQEECTTALLAETSGISGGNLFQQLNELHSASLVFQPSRGRYRLSEFGRMVLEVLAWECRTQARIGSQPQWFETSPE